jgi:hypothetical protein
VNVTCISSHLVVRRKTIAFHFFLHCVCQSCDGESYTFPPFGCRKRQADVSKDLTLCQRALEFVSRGLPKVLQHTSCCTCRLFSRTRHLDCVCSLCSATKNKEPHYDTRISPSTGTPASPWERWSQSACRRLRRSSDGSYAVMLVESLPQRMLRRTVSDIKPFGYVWHAQPVSDLKRFPYVLHSQLYSPTFSLSTSFPHGLQTGHLQDHEDAMLLCEASDTPCVCNMSAAMIAVAKDSIALLSNEALTCMKCWKKKNWRIHWNSHLHIAVAFSIYEKQRMDTHSEVSTVANEIPEETGEFRFFAFLP